MQLNPVSISKFHQETTRYAQSLEHFAAFEAALRKASTSDRSTTPGGGTICLKVERLQDREPEHPVPTLILTALGQELHFSLVGEDVTGKALIAKVYVTRHKPLFSATPTLIGCFTISQNGNVNFYESDGQTFAKIESSAVQLVTHYFLAALTKTIAVKGGSTWEV